MTLMCLRPAIGIPSLQQMPLYHQDLILEMMGDDPSLLNQPESALVGNLVLPLFLYPAQTLICLRHGHLSYVSQRIRNFHAVDAVVPGTVHPGILHVEMRHWREHSIE